VSLYANKLLLTKNKNKQEVLFRRFKKLSLKEIIHLTRKLTESLLLLILGHVPFAADDFQ
jgi:hypothetical protein